MQNDTYQDTIYEALLYQTGDHYNYMPLNQTTTEGNDDQVFWGIACIQAAERNFTNPPKEKQQWLYLAQSVFNTMAWRWDDESCGGGLRWQIFRWNAGYDYKNSVSNIGLFHLGARLARYTGNDTYVDLCEKVYDWLVDVKFVTEGDEWWFIWDGAGTEANCSVVSKGQWTYNAGLMIAGCAYLYNYTEDAIWLNRTQRFIHGAQVFLNNSIMYEAACQPINTCNNDQRCFKAYLARFLSLASILAPPTYPVIRPIIEASAKGAAQSCSGGTDGHTCGTNWFANGWDGNYGLGEQMAALDVIQSLVAPYRDPPYTQLDGGSSKGNGSAGTIYIEPTDEPLDLHRKDTVGAAIITAVVGLSVIGLMVYLVL
ncbi:unnamed protein product [Ambrosiozyma monospora]|uniref:Unnamed protein product n=1 Tax=Ambrosiozyma monospora TaxID=43982 RepID=A0ACB5SZL3_AMBMO|nr:unnamed protein product [Ambrosiozyma monospora]